MRRQPSEKSTLYIRIHTFGAGHIKIMMSEMLLRIYGRYKTTTPLNWHSSIYEKLASEFWCVYACLCYRRISCVCVFNVGRFTSLYRRIYEITLVNSNIKFHWIMPIRRGAHCDANIIYNQKTYIVYCARLVRKHVWGKAKFHHAPPPSIPLNNKRFQSQRAFQNNTLDQIYIMLDFNCFSYVYMYIFIYCLSLCVCLINIVYNKLYKQNIWLVEANKTKQ